ncbi:AcrR family transcriptional regulator [Streptomyces umbrinus]|uniref:AcrR family transcriptional regulator n=1 Tax=Streptomyces umbrinus TaxID=67370 RepID=A0ABU0SHY8_9ACTN|nr:TetR/AcrR family transcriptional regulator [Streptomyces umbrinus]MDQ1023170.1 AcrR family transcriptional regulator [Streptomyces umbrinus]
MARPSGIEVQTYRGDMGPLVRRGAPCARPHRDQWLQFAREAGVGIATMFRRFLTKEEPVAAVFADRMDAYADAAAIALEDPDPWHGFVGYIETACAMQAADYGFADVLTTSVPTAKAMEGRRNEALEGMLRLIGRAKVAGRLREDFDSSDIVLLRMANAGVVNATGGTAADARRRVVALFIQSLESLESPARGPLPPSPPHDDLHKAVLRASPAVLTTPEPDTTS